MYITNNKDHEPAYTLSVGDMKELIHKAVESAQQPQAPPMPDNELITRDELCAFLHITPVSEWKLRKRIKYPVVKVGRRLLFDKEVVLAKLKGK